ncbi:MAG TPA: BlaI/MecI/CopY family transcriptional regulator [Chthonomonadaceae bacterium]|nr:BlaI/MecI/CopY family transcriptional regulator [Chthonomonadaceae bacterium]
MTKRLRQRFRPERTGINAPLGQLEEAVMRYVWACGDAGCLAADVQQAFETEQAAALTTVLTTLDRLLHKGIVRREREGKAYCYWAEVPEPELEQRIVAGVLDSLIARFPKAVATYFSQAGGESANLQDLARRVEELQRQRQQEEKKDA